MIQLKCLLKRYDIRVLIIQILLISIQLYTRTILVYATILPPFIKTPTRSSIYNRGGICSAITPPTLLPITGTPGGGSGSNTTIGIEYIEVYSAIAISIRVNIVYKRVTDIVKDVQAMDCQLNELEDFLNKIKDELAFLKYSVIALVRNVRLLNIK